MGSVLSRSELDSFLYIWYQTVRNQNGLSHCGDEVYRSKIGEGVKVVPDYSPWDYSPQGLKSFFVDSTLFMHLFKTIT